MKNFTYLKITLLALLLSATSVFSQIPSNGLIGYFPFSGNANDHSGSGIIGVPSTGSIYANTPPVLTADRHSVANSAYDFEPAIYTTSYIDLGKPSQFNFGTGSFSISLWM